MKQALRMTAGVFAIGVITFISCKKDYSCENCKENKSPVANAGADQIITLSNDTVLLDGSASTDPDNNIISYVWAKISGPSSTIANANVAQTQVTGLGPAVYQFELKVTDSQGLFSKDTVQVTVNAAVAFACDNTSRPLVTARLTQIGTLSQQRGGVTVATAGNKILFAGGGGWFLADFSTRVDIYNLTTQTWSTAELSEPRNQIAAVAAGDKIFFGGGITGDGSFTSSAVDIYDVAADTWSTSSLSVDGTLIAAGAVGNKVFFAGGESIIGNNARRRRVDIYNLTTSTWSTAALSEDKIFHSAVTVGDRIYFAGGVPRYLTSGAASKNIDIYDNSTNTWSKSQLQVEKSGHATIGVGSKIYWAAGCHVEVRDINTGNTSIKQLSSQKGWTIDFGQNAVLKDNQIVYLDHNQSATEPDRFDVYDISTDSWKIGVLPISIRATSIISVNNTIYLAGGFINGVLSDKVWKLEF